MSVVGDRPPRALTRSLAGVLVVLVSVLPILGGGAAPAGAAPAIEAQGVALAPSATCAYGDVDITYAAQDAQQQAVTFSTTGGAVLAQRTTNAYKRTFTGTEHVLTHATTPPAAGTVVAVHVVVGAPPLSGANAAELTIAYRCDPNRNDQGGKNTVVWTCWGDVGACPATADEALVVAQTPGAVPGAASPALAVASIPTAVPAAAVTAAPTFSG